MGWGNRARAITSVSTSPKEPKFKLIAMWIVSLYCTFCLGPKVNLDMIVEDNRWPKGIRANVSRSILLWLYIYPEILSHLLVPIHLVGLEKVQDVFHFLAKKSSSTTSF